MMIQKAFGLSLKVVASVLLLSGCSSWVFPDFADETDIVIDDGGKVEKRKVNNSGILVADKENAIYEDENEAVFVQNENVTEKVAAAETVKVEAKALEPIKEKIPAVEDKKEVKSVLAEKSEPKKVEIKEVAAENVVTKEESYQALKTDDALPSMHYLAETIYFDNGSGVVDYKFYKVLKELAKTAKANDAVVSVNGYASSRTRNTDPVSHKLANFKVSAERAQNVAKVLRKYGVKSDRIVVQSFSDSMPVYQEVMPEGERLNRRVEIYLTY